MTKRSFEAINYALRPNKNVERKLIVSTLQALRPTFPIGAYRYVGFGSMWFPDFVLMHRVLGIYDMVTIEGQVSRSKRVEFNKPFACITVKMEQASTALPAVLDAKPAVVWLDYDGPLKDAVGGDLETAVAAMASGSIVLASVNAKVEQLRGHEKDDEEMSPEAYLAEICDDLTLITESARLTRNDFPQLAADILHSKLKSAALKKPGHEYVPIWTFMYADDAEMITVGGMVVNAVDKARIDGLIAGGLPYYSPTCPFEIDLPTLTEKEKRALDKLLPKGTPLVAGALEFELRPSEVAAYQKFYLQYPVFNEISS